MATAPEPPGVTLERLSTADQVARHLREQIWAGELLPGTHLREVPLSKSFGVSRPTVREAIRQLAAEGLVHHEMHHGAVVAALTADDLTDLYRVRRMLELDAVRRPPEDPEALAVLKKAVEDMERALAEKDYEVIVEYDTRFHAAIVSLLGSPRLDRFYAQISAEIRLALGILSVVEQRLFESGAEPPPDKHPDAERQEEAVAEHRRIYERIAEGVDVHGLLEAHLNSAERRLKRILASRSDEMG